MPNQFTTNSGKTKQQIVAEVLRGLNFLTDDPPPDWKNRVEQVLDRQGVQVHFTTIYETRKKEMERIQKLKKEAPVAAATPSVNRNHAATASPVAPVPPKETDISDNLTLSDALEIKNFAKKFGGLKSLSDAALAVLKLYSD